MPYYIIALSTFKQQIHMLVKNISESLKLLLPQKKLKTVNYADATFIIKKSALCYHKPKDGTNHCLPSSHGTLSFDTESIKQSKQ